MGNGQEVSGPAGEGWDLEHWGRSLTLVNWCTMMCKQCRFMSNACVLSAASRICNGRNHEAQPSLPTDKGGARRYQALPVAHSALLRSFPGSACSMPAVCCCRSHSSRGLQTGSWTQVKELPSQRTHIHLRSPILLPLLSSLGGYCQNYTDLRSQSPSLCLCWLVL